MSDRERAAKLRAAEQAVVAYGQGDASRAFALGAVRDVAADNAALQEPEGQASDPRAQSEAKQGSENPNSPSLLASSRAPKPADQKPGFHETMDREAVEPPERVVPQDDLDRQLAAYPALKSLESAEKVIERFAVIEDRQAGEWLRRHLDDVRAYLSRPPVPQDEGEATPLQRLEDLAAKKGRSMAQVIEDAERIDREWRERVVVCQRCGHAQEQPEPVAPVPQDEERDVKRYIAWLCEGCDECDPPDGSERCQGPCNSPSLNGAEVVRAEDYERLATAPEPTNAAIEAEARNRLGGDHPNCESRVNSFIAGARWMRKAVRMDR